MEMNLYQHILASFMASILAAAHVFALLPASVATIILPQHVDTERLNCQQAHNFFFKAKSSDLFWVGESWDGNCQQSQLIQVLLSPNEAAQVIKLPLLDYNDWKWAENGKDYVRSETAVRFNKSGSIFTSSSANFTVKAPAFKPQLYNLYYEQYNGTCPEQWNENFGYTSIVIPKLRGDKSYELVYAYPGGFYFNYQIDQVIYFPDSQYLLVFTENAILCSENKSTYGFLLLKKK